MKFLNIALLLILVLIQNRLWNGNGSIPDVKRLEEMKAMQIEENKALVERNISLGAEVMDLKEGLEAIEGRARSEMGMIRSDETFYRIIERSESAN